MKGGELFVPIQDEYIHLCFWFDPHLSQSSGFMKPPAQDPTAERLAAGLLTAFFALFGWFTLWQGGVTLKGKSGATSFVDGYAGILVAGFAFIVATMGLALLLRSFAANRPAYYIGGAVMHPPATALRFISFLALVNTHKPGYFHATRASSIRRRPT